jgi:AraC family transcriptional regulator
MDTQCVQQHVGFPAAGGVAAPTDSLFSDALTKLLERASAALDSDQATAKDCIQRATELLRGGRVDGQRPSADRAGLLTWQEKRVVEYIEAHMDMDIRVSDLAKVVRLSVGHFFRVFRRSFGESPLAYVARRRITRSQKLMLSSPAPLCQIALECGMSDQPHFTRVFRRIVGVNPAAWRRRFSKGPV